MRSTIRKTFLFAMAAACPAPLFAQGLTIQSITDVRFHGGLGIIALDVDLKSVFHSPYGIQMFFTCVASRRNMGPSARA